MYSFKYKVGTKQTYLEELFLPRLSSAYRYWFNPLQFSVINAFFGVSLAIQHELPKLGTGFRYFVQGLGIGLPYYALNEILTGMLIRRYGREQYFVSNVGAALLTGIGYFAFLAATGKGRHSLTK